VYAVVAVWSLAASDLNDKDLDLVDEEALLASEKERVLTAPKGKRAVVCSVHVHNRSW